MDSRLQPAGMTQRGTGGHDGGARREGRQGPDGSDGGGWVGRGPFPASTRLSFPRKRESRGPGREPRAGGGGVVGRSMSAFRGGEKTLDSRLQPAGMTEGGRRGAGGKDGGGWVGRGVLPASPTIVIPAQAGIQRPGPGAKGRRWWGGGALHVCIQGRRKDPGFPLTTCGNDRRRTEGGRREGKDRGGRREG